METWNYAAFRPGRWCLSGQNMMAAQDDAPVAFQSQGRWAPSPSEAVQKSAGRRTRGQSDADSRLPGRRRRSLRRVWIPALRELAGSRQPTARGNRQAPRTGRAGARPWLAERDPCTWWLWLHTFRLSPEDQSPRSNSTQRHTALRMTLAHAPFEKMTARRQICSSAASAAATTETARSKSRKASPGCRR